MTDRYKSRAGTHANDCWSWGPAHYECAVRKIKELQEAAVKLRNLRADAVHSAALANIRAELLAAALEEVARVCEELDEEALCKEGRLASGRECAAAIREMKEQA